MRILHIHQALRVGGVEAFISALANEMVKEHDVTVCTIFQPTDKDIFIKKLSPKIKLISCHKTKKGISIKELFSIYRIIRTGKYDIVNMHGFMYYYMFSILFLPKQRFVYTVHSDAILGNTKWDKRFLLIKKLIFKYKLAFPITISEASNGSFIKLYHCAGHLINNGIEKPVINHKKETITICRKTSKTRVFIHPARIDYPKNQLVLCKVFKKLIDEGCDVVLLIAGASHKEEIFKSIEPFFSERIIYMGEREDVPQLLGECDAMCLPSIYEGMPISVIESFAVRCIPICSPVGGIINMINDGFNGFLSESSSEEDYYNCMKRFLATDKATVLKMKQHSMNSFAKYDIKKTAENYIAYYNELISKDKK